MKFVVHTLANRLFFYNHSLTNCFFLNHFLISKSFVAKRKGFNLRYICNMYVYSFAKPHPGLHAIACMSTEIFVVYNNPVLGSFSRVLGFPFWPRTTSGTTSMESADRTVLTADNGNEISMPPPKKRIKLCTEMR